MYVRVKKGQKWLRRSMAGALYQRISAFAYKCLHRAGLKNDASPHRKNTNAAGLMPVIDEKKIAKLEALCRKLLEHDQIVNSGKLQFLNLNKVKEHLGVKWSYLESIILNISAEVILKYTETDDIFFRYRENEFVIIFVRTSKEEAELKCRLIASEIQRLIFEETEKETGGAHIDMRHFIVSIPGFLFKHRDEKPIDEMQKKFIEKEMIADDIAFQTAPPEAIDVEVPAGHQPHAPDQGLYVPIIDLQTGKKSFLVMTKRPDIYQDNIAPFEQYLSSYNSLKISDQTALDISHLQHTSNLLEQLDNEKIEYLICPLNFKILNVDKFLSTWYHTIEKNKHLMKQKLILLLWDVPLGQERAAEIRTLQASLSSYCKGICIKLNHYSNEEILTYMGYRFTHVCIHIDNSYPYPALTEKITRANQKAKTIHMKTIALLSKDSKDLLADVGRAQFDYVGGAPLAHKPLAHKKKK